MTDERYVYQQDSKSRKSQAQAARKRRSHCGKAGCQLPHETMSRKERDALNGPVESINLNEPVRDFEIFTALSHQMQETYIWNLIKKYDVSIKALSQMFHASEPTVRKYFEENLPQLKPTTNKGITKARKEKLREFRRWAGIKDTEAEQIKDVNHVETEEPDMNNNRVSYSDYSSNHEHAERKKSMNGTMEFYLNGKIDVSLVTLILEQAINANPEGELVISYKPV